MRRGVGHTTLAVRNAHLCDPPPLLHPPDSEPLGWAASFGQLDAIRALISCGADPLRPANKAGQTPLSDATRERHQHVVDFFNE